MNCVVFIFSIQVDCGQILRQFLDPTINKPTDFMLANGIILKIPGQP